MKLKSRPPTIGPLQTEMVTLRDGTCVAIRPIRATDAHGLQVLFGQLSAESISLRYLGQRRDLSKDMAEHLANVDYHSRMALVAVVEGESGERIIGEARYDSCGPSRPDLAEAAVVVEDTFQGRGLGSILVDRLVDYARRCGIRAFLATVRYDNATILYFIKRSGLPFKRRIESGMWEIEVLLDPPAAS